MRIGRPTLLALGLAALLAGCTEDATAPGKCPGFCPGGQLRVVDTILYIVSRDSSHLGYVQPDSARSMLAVNAFGVDSRPVFLLGAVTRSTTVSTSDTAVKTALSVDSALLTLHIDRRDTLATNLRINLYRLPITLDSTTTFAALTGPFTDSLVRTVNVDSVLALPGGVDSTTGDSVVANDSTRIGLRIVIKLDSAEAAYRDSTPTALGIRITADSLASATFLSVNAGGGGPILSWWGTFDSSGKSVPRQFGTAINQFNSFVHNVPPPVLDSNLLVGGVPSARSLLRFSLPRGIRDSTQVVRATLLMIPVTAPVGVPSDSVVLTFGRVAVDLGAKSSCVPAAGGCIPPAPGDSAIIVATTVPMGSTDTIFTDLTLIVRAWQGDTAAPQALMVQQMPEGENLISIRLYSSRSTAFRPALHLTYVPRYSFGNP